MQLSAGQTGRVPASSAAIVFAGALRVTLDGRPAVMDVNHLLIVPRGAACLPVTALTHTILEISALPESRIGGGPHLQLRDSAAQGHTGCAAYCAGYAFAMQEYVNRAVGQPPSLREIGAACGLSPFAASRIFHRHVGISLRAYLKRLRLRNALQRVERGDDIASIALDFGFCDHAHFSNAFRAEFGIAPTEWRLRATSGTRPDPRAVGQ